VAKNEGVGYLLANFRSLNAVSTDDKGVGLSLLDSLTYGAGHAALSLGTGIEIGQA